MRTATPCLHSINTALLCGSRQYLDMIGNHPMQCRTQASLQTCSQATNFHKSHMFSPVPLIRISHTKKPSQPKSIASMSCSILLVFLLWQGCALAQKCYLPNGSEATSFTPCGPTSSNQASACCLPEDTCLSNRLCLGADLLIRRGSCTDPTWQSYGCAPWCQDGKIPASE